MQLHGRMLCSEKQREERIVIFCDSRINRALWKQMRVLSLQAIVEGRLRQMSNGFMLLKSFCNCKGEEHAFKNGVSNYEKEVTLHSWKCCCVSAGCLRQQSELPHHGSVCLEKLGVCPEETGRSPGFPGNTSAIISSEEQDDLPASLSSLSAGTQLLPQDGSEQSVILRVLISSERAVLQLCNQEPITDCRGVHKYLGTGMVTWITHRSPGTWEQ